jgi:hypothetical protein
VSNDANQVTVAPADIRAFAAVLDDLTAQMIAMRAQVLATNVIDFGEYAKSGALDERYHEAVAERAAGLDRMILTGERFTDGTAQLARDYSDVDDLNAARAQAITQALGEQGGESK